MIFSMFDFIYRIYQKHRLRGRRGSTQDQREANYGESIKSLDRFEPNNTPFQNENTHSAFDGPISHEPPTLVPGRVAPKNYCKRF